VTIDSLVLQCSPTKPPALQEGRPKAGESELICARDKLEAVYAFHAFLLPHSTSKRLSF
jgi:hypothetical protein